MLNQIKTDNTVNTEETDVLGGGILPTNIYGSKISMAYLTESTKGAIGVVLHLMTPSQQNIRGTVWITNRNKETYYVKDNEKRALPGFLLMNSLGLLTVGKEVLQLDQEEKTVMVYDFDAKKELPTNVPVLVELLNQEIYTAVEHRIVDSTTLNTSTGKYEPTGKTRETNEIVKFFRASDKKTVSEVQAQEDATFFDKWLEKNKDKVIDKSDKSVKPQQGAPKVGNSPAPAPSKSLFG